MAKTWVVLPAYNEEKSLPPLFASFAEIFGEAKLEYEVIIVNDGSKDRTEAVIKDYATRMPIRLVNNDGNKGLAETIRRGLFEATRAASDRDVIVAMDADNTHPVGLVPRMLQAIKEGNDVVIASRYREGSYVRGLSMHRRFLSKGASWLFQLFFPTHGVKDYTCGYRAYTVASLKSLIQRYGEYFVSERGFSCMVDILLRLREDDLVFTELPMVLRYDQKQGASKMRVVQTIFDTFRLLLTRRFLPSKNV